MNRPALDRAGSGPADPPASARAASRPSCTTRAPRDTSARPRRPRTGAIRPVAIVAIVVMAWAPIAIADPEEAPAAAGPGSAEAGYPHGAWSEDCESCHREEGWLPLAPGARKAHAKTKFPLQGAHAQAACRACHASLDFKAKKPLAACVACHADVHRGELGQDCSRCHTSRSFIDFARMARAHQSTRFPLSGAHVAADCSECHRLDAPGRFQYVNTPTECQACHLADYLATTDPPHQSSGFPTDCVQCHTPVSWRGRFPDHDARYFPITSGTHRGRWSSCNDCHLTPGSFTSFSCINCHEHSNRTEVDGHHSGVGGYTYTPTSCYTCHPRGNEN